MTYQYPIVGTGSALPRTRLSNDELIALHGLDSTNEWIVERTGITQRYICSEGETTSTLAIAAAREALADVKPEDVGIVLVATCTPDRNFPSVAAQVQGALGLPAHAVVLDVNAACGGFISALAVAKSLLETTLHTHALVIGAEAMSTTLDWTDRSTCILFGDGAGAIVIKKEKAEGEKRGLLAVDVGADGSKGEMLATVDGKVHMNGREVFKHAVREMGTLPAIVAGQGLALENIDWVVPHQANIRILEAAAKALGLPFEKVVATVGVHANTSGASIPLAMHAAVQGRKFNRGNVLLLQAFGAGFVWGSALIRW
ncbi:MAG TPA: beta-ketoacyl-ACP synthase III [Alphaproteobacteria bacterium]|nr:beta-ketoacyl-ACP synthase III [Alphaproteobacteria bacterium]